MAKRFMYVCFGIVALVVAFHLGAVRGGASSYGSDIAIGIGTIGHNQQIPLPYYPDGTQATQDECVWIVTPWQLHSGHNSTLGFNCKGKANRIVGFTQITIEGTYYDSLARYLIIGVRGGASVAQQSTWGQIKAEFGE
jgi:hypothetical protein